MSSEKAWERAIHGERWDITIHITKAQMKRTGDVSYVIPYRIGIDFDSGVVHNFIPNLTLGDVVRLIELLDFLNDEGIREGFKKISRRLGIELDFRRKLKLDIFEDQESDYKEIEVHYEDPRTETLKQMVYLGGVDVKQIPEVIKGLKEALLEYMHLIEKWLVLGEFLKEKK